MKKTKPTEARALESYLEFWLRFVSNQVPRRFESQLATYGISVTEWVAMRALYRRLDVTHAELVDALGMTKGAASKIISKLESKGLAQRNQTQDSLREQILCLTDDGNQIVPKLAALADENDSHFFGHLSESQHQSLMVLIKELVVHYQLKQVPTK